MSKSAMSKSATPKSATPKSAMSKSEMPKGATPKGATPKSATPKGADIIVTDARVITMDERQPFAEALAIAGNTIVAVGTVAEITALRTPATQMIDAQGASVTPGFNEAHLHLFSGARELEQLHLSGIKGFDALAEASRAYAVAHPDALVLVGQSTNYTILGEGKRITRHDLDRIEAERPFVLFAPDHHTAWANTAALAKAEILHGKSLGPGNEIVMADNGLAEGELREGQAFQPVLDLDSGFRRSRLGLSTGGEPDPAPTKAELEADRATIKNGLDYCARHGITSLQNMDGNFYALELIDAVNQSRGVTCRARVPFHMKSFMTIDALDKAVAMRERYASESLSSGFVKFFMDGVLDSWTAVMIEDYPNRRGWRGEPLFEPEWFSKIAVEADRRRLQMAVHAIGDGAVRIVLDGYEAAKRANGRSDPRHRIEHIEVLHPDDVGRFAELGVVASMQPPHVPGEAGVPMLPTVEMIGEARWADAYAWNTLRAAGARVVFATDWPVSPIDPIASIQTSMIRRKWSPAMPDNRQTLMQALASYTSDGAYVEFMEGRKGILAPGYLADIVVLSGDLEKTDPHALHEIRPRITLCDGRRTYEAAA